MRDIFTEPSEKNVPVDSTDLADVQTESAKILTKRGIFMTKFDLKQFIMEVLADPAVGQQFKSTRSMPITMTAGRDIQVTDVQGTGPSAIVTFTITGQDGTSYTIRRKWSDVTGQGGDWFDPVSEAAQKKTYGNKTYSASPGSVSAIKKSGDSAKKAVGAGKFDWATSPYAAAQAAHIVATGEPTVKKGSKKKTHESDKKEAKTCEGCGTKYEGKTCSECGWKE